MKKTVFIIALLSMGLAFIGCSTVQERQADARSEYVEGLSYLNEKYYKSALSSFKDAVSDDPEYEAALFARGCTYYVRRSEGKAIDDMTAIISRNPKNSGAWARRGFYYFFEGEEEKSISDCSRAIELNPKNPYAWRYRAYVYYRQEKTDKYISDISRAIKLDPYNIREFKERSNAYIKIKDYKKALSDLKSIRTLDIINLEASIGIMKLYEITHSDNGSYDIEEDDTASSAYEDLKIKCYSFAVRGLTKKIKKGKATRVYYYLRSLAYIREKEYEKAEADLTKLIEMAPDYEDAYYQRAHSYYLHGKYTAALEDCNKLLKIDSACSYYYSMKALCLFWTGKGSTGLSKALAEADKAVKLCPSDRLAYSVRAFIYSLMKKTNKEQKDRLMSEAIWSEAQRCYNRNYLSEILWYYPGTAETVKAYLKENPYHGGVKELDKKITEILMLKGKK